MSFNRLMYDQCSYKKDLDQSVGTLGYLLNPVKYENCTKCRHEFGIVGGTAVSHIRGNLVDLENDLRNQTRPNSRCPSKKYTPPTDNKLYIEGNHCSKPREVDLNMVHLPPCQMIRYPNIALPPAQTYGNCPVASIKYTKPSCN